MASPKTKKEWKTTRHFLSYIIVGAYFTLVKVFDTFFMDKPAKLC